MTLRKPYIPLVLLIALILTGCTGGEQTAAQTSTAPSEEAAPPVTVDPARKLAAISPAIPFYEGATYDGDLTRRDLATVSNRYGSQSTVYTLATRDSFPQVWHYYVTYLAQFRRFEPIRPFPPSNQIQRSIEVRLNEAMQDPFIPGDTLGLDENQVILQVVERSDGAGTVIRYIVRPPAPQQTRIAEAFPAGTGEPSSPRPSEGP
jgi:hypothetical protein